MSYNQFQSLCTPGVTGQVISHDFSHHLIFQRGQSRTTPAQSIAIYTALTSPGRWNFGYHIIDGDKEIRMLPGEHPGWFQSESDARLYALEHVRISGLAMQEAIPLIQEQIYMLRNPTLF